MKKDYGHYTKRSSESILKKQTSARRFLATKWPAFNRGLDSATGIIMVGVIVGSKKTGVNPDNVATPIAASFGDLITLAILAWISQGLYKCLGGFTAAPPDQRLQL